MPILPGWVQALGEYNLIWMFFLFFILCEFTEWIDEKWKE